MINKSQKIGRENDVHLIRRVQHSGTGLMVLLVLYFFSHNICLYGAFAGTLWVFLVSLSRKYSEYCNQLFIKNFKFLLRKHEIDNANLPGAFYFLLGLFITLCFFEKEIVILATTILSFGDPFASLIGIKLKGP